MAANNTAGTEESRRVCEIVSRASGGTCLLAFSRGKDSIAAWLWLRNFFSRVIPFHVAVVPGLRFVDASLKYYERVFGTPILRLQSGAINGLIMGLVYQEPGADKYIDKCGLWRYDYEHIVELVRQEYNVPQAWVAYGVSGKDNLVRMMYVKRRYYSEERRTFYPCFDWTPSMVVEYVRSAGVKLPPDYLLSNRSFATINNLAAVTRMRDVFPSDFDRLRKVFPLILAPWARNEFRRLGAGRGE